MKSHKFVESARASLFAGCGGNGCCAFRREACVPRGGPSGGDGGRGGHVILQADDEVDSLIALYYRPEQRAEDGQHGMGKQCHGRNGKDLLIKIPRGTEIWDQATGEKIADLVEHGEQLTICRGGKGGLGNCHFQTNTHQTPREHTGGEAGEERVVRFELKLVADIGLIGLPNAGKSTLLGAISHAHPKVAPYPFTTLNPIIGTLQYEFQKLKAVDIPGLIKGAHEGVGLGDAFLRHVERTRFLVYVIDMAGTDGRKPEDDYATLRQEMGLYNPELPARPYIVVANKMDMPEAEINLPRFIKKTRQKPIPMAAELGEGVEALKQAIFKQFFKGD